MENKVTSMHDAMAKALLKAQDELDRAHYLEECGKNPGIRKMNENRAEWLRWIVYLANIGFETEKLLAESESTDEESKQQCEECEAEVWKEVAAKDKLIADLQLINEQLRDQLKERQTAYDLEVEYRKELATRAKIDWCTEIIRQVHDRCWLDGTVLVTPVEYLDKCLLELARQ